MVQVVNVVSVPRFGHVGLALSISVGAWVNVLVLLLGLVKMGVLRPRYSEVVFGLRVVAGTVAMFFVTVEVVDLLAGAWVAGAKLWERSLGLAAVVVGATSVYVTALFTAGLRPMHIGLRATR